MNILPTPDLDKTVNAIGKIFTIGIHLKLPEKTTLINSRDEKKRRYEWLITIQIKDAKKLLSVLQIEYDVTDLMNTNIILLNSPINKVSNGIIYITEEILNHLLQWTKII